MLTVTAFVIAIVFWPITLLVLAVMYWPVTLPLAIVLCVLYAVCATINGIATFFRKA